MSICELKDMIYLICGLGKSGQGAIKLLEKHGCEYLVYDDDANKLEFYPEAKVYRPTDIVDCAVLSPGFFGRHINFDNAITETDLGFLFLNHLGLKCPVIGVTGTNGKTTTVKMLEHIFACAGKKPAVAGNIGKPLCELLTERTDFDMLILELSSFQLQESVHINCDLSIITNIKPNHLDVHSDYEEYFSAKLKLADFTGGKTVTMIPKQELIGRIDTEDFVFIDPETNFEYVEKPFSDLGEYNDYLLAKTAAAYFGISEEDCEKYILDFKKPRYRFEILGTVKGKKIINDSKSTSSDSAVSALKSITDDCVLIAGGKDKNIDYADFFSFVSKRGGVYIIATGENSGKLTRAAFANGFFDIDTASDLKEAVKKAFARNASAILFSPMAASFDRFSDYVARGKAFDDAIKEYEKN